MPRKLSRTLRLATTGAIAAATLASLPAGAAAASCPELPTSNPFATYGDARDYSLAPGGDFESLSWTGSGSPAIVAGNNTLNGLGAAGAGLLGTGSSSVELEGADAITSPTVCVSDLHPYLRFAAKAQDASSRLVIEALYTERGVAKTKILEELPADLWRTWAPSKLVPFGEALPLSRHVESMEVNVRLRLKDRRGSWRVDDFFIDPYKR